MQRFVVFFDQDRAFAHFGWNGAFCGHPVVEGPDWDLTALRLCPKCVRAVPQGREHIYPSETARSAACGFARDFSVPLKLGFADTDPRICQRCVVRHGMVYRIGPASVSLMIPQTFVPERARIVAPTP